MWYKNGNFIDSKLPSGASFTCTKTICALVDTDLLLMMKLAAESNVYTASFVN